MLANLRKLSEHVLKIDGNSDLKEVVQLLIDSNFELLEVVFKQLDVDVHEITDAQQIVINGFNASIDSWSAYKKKLEKLDDSDDSGDLCLKPKQVGHIAKKNDDKEDRDYFCSLRVQPPEMRLFETDHESLNECVFIQGLIKDKQEKAEKDKTSELSL
tara:strand:+ start:1115 stop:1588 length:474 start_codon:yes stop_codon:yes gene_type:complete